MASGTVLWLRRILVLGHSVSLASGTFLSFYVLWLQWLLVLSMNSCRSQDLPGKSSIGALNLELDRTESGRPLTGVSGLGSDWAQ